LALEYFMSHSRATAVITQPKFAARFSALASDLRFIAVTKSDAGEPAMARTSMETVPFDELRRTEAEAPSHRSEPLAPNSVQYTSGTTSRPKGVVWTHANALWAAKTTSTHAQLTEKDVHLIYFPLFHTNALAYSVLGTLWSGGTVVLMPRFSASRFWEVALKNRCTWASIVGFTTGALRAQPVPEAHHFRMWAGAGDIPFVRKIFGIKTMGWYGMTETVTQCIVSERSFTGPPWSMGVPASEYELSVRREDGGEVAFGETGRLWIKGTPGISLFLEYLNDEAATASSFDEYGWFDTGDNVTPLANGHILFSGRAKDMLKVGAENVAALEVETVILRVPGVTEVAVVGKPDPMLDEVPVAFVVAQNPSPSLAEAIHHICRQSLADFKRPRDVIFVEALPKGLLDKVLKKDLRARLLVP
jgi:crotonobetaine/carnitine-CoA ligase